MKPYADPYLGAHVLYTLSDADAQAINAERHNADAHLRKTRRPFFEDVPPAEPGDPGRTGHVKHQGNLVGEGDVFPAVIVRTWNEPGTPCNLKVHLDGTDDYWATSRTPGDGVSEWHWPPDRAEAIQLEPLRIFPGQLVIVSGLDGHNWEDQLSQLINIQAVRLDDDRVAIRHAGTAS